MIRLTLADTSPTYVLVILLSVPRKAEVVDRPALTWDMDTIKSGGWLQPVPV